MGLVSVCVYGIWRHPWGFADLASWCPRAALDGRQRHRPEELHGGDPGWKVDPVRSSPIIALVPQIEFLQFKLLFLNADREEGQGISICSWLLLERWGIWRLMLSSDAHPQWPLASLGLACR